MQDLIRNHKKRVQSQAAEYITKAYEDNLQRVHYNEPLYFPKSFTERYVCSRKLLGSQGWYVEHTAMCEDVLRVGLLQP